jgi:biopolymer transport protein ExbD
VLAFRLGRLQPQSRGALNMSDPVALDDGDEAPRKARRSRRLARHLKRGGAEELNIVSMIDVFAVLVFFLLVNSSIAASRLNVLSLNLPAADQTATPPDDEKLALSVSMLPDALVVSDRNGAVRRLANIPTGYNIAALSDVLVQIKKAAPKEDSITLLISPDVPYDDVVKVMDAARLTPAAAQSLGLPREMYPVISIGDAANAARKKPSAARFARSPSTSSR